MKWVLLVLVLVAGAALAEEQQQEEVEEGRLFRKGVWRRDVNQYKIYAGY